MSQEAAALTASGAYLDRGCRIDTDRIDADIALVHRLLEAQFPQWAGLPLRHFASTGVDNTLYRLGAEMVVRLPRSDWSSERVAKEFQWLPWLAPQLPIAIPLPLAGGVPAEGYPWVWAVYIWLDGEPATIERIADPVGFAKEIAAFIAALRRIDPTGGPPAGLPLAQRDTSVRAAIVALRNVIDADTATAVWEAAVRLPAWDGPPVWLHGDLAPGNVLMSEGRPSAVIDFAAMGVGDPSDDVRAAWTLVPPGARADFRAALQVDDATWARGRGRALAQSLAQLLLYRDAEPTFAVDVRKVIEEILDGYQHDA
jgi:aminoglycoside phosphotransferase (APT) family kinase protein